MSENRNVRRVVATLALAALCGSPTANGQTTRDSAGIRIVTSNKPSWTAAQQLRLSAAPVLVIGDRDEEPYQFTRLRQSFELSDGRIAVAEVAANEIRLFDAKGIFLNKFGSKGDGPGEFRQMGRMQRLTGDTIAVIHDRGMISRFTAAGKFIRRTNDYVAPKDMTSKFIMTSPMLALDGGSRLLLSQELGRTAEGTGVRSHAKFSHRIAGANDRTLRDLGELPATESISEKGQPGQLWLRAEEIFVSNGRSFWLAYPATYSLTRYSVAGIPQLIVRRAWTPVPITQRDKEVFAEEWLKRWTKAKGPELERERKDLLDDSYAINLPAYSAVLEDKLGRIWVRAPKAIDGAVAGSLNDYAIGPSTWSVFDAKGVWLGDVGMPALFAPTDIGADYVLGIQRSEDEAPTVVRYRLGTRL